MGADDGEADPLPAPGGSVVGVVAQAAKSATHRDAVTEIRFIEAIFAQLEITQTSVRLLHCNIAIKLKATHCGNIVRAAACLFMAHELARALKVT